MRARLLTIAIEFDPSLSRGFISRSLLFGLIVLH
jgi:hypothetical protein